MPARRESGKRDAREKIETLSLQLEAPASPKHVADMAQMFSDALNDIAPGLPDGDVTLVVSNRNLRSELRGYGTAGRAAVAHVGELLENPSKKVQAEPRLYLAAATIAKRLQPLARFEPKIYRGHGRKIVAVLGETYTKALQAIGEALRPETTGAGILGETVVYSPILRFGRTREDAAPTVRIRLGVRFQDVTVEEHLVRVCADLTVSGESVPARVKGRWVEGNHGLLELRDPVVTSIDRNFTAWTGEQVVQEAREHADTFGADEFLRLLERLRNIRGD